MKTLILLILFISCTTPEQETKYIPKEVIVNDTLTKLVNNARFQENLALLKSESLLIALSKEKAIQMEANNEVNHNGFESLQTNAISYAQIVGYGYTNETSLFNAYINSAEHSKYIFGNFTHIGSYTFKTYNCVLFAKY